MAEPPVIGFIGGGHMASAIIRGLLDAGHPGRCIRVAEPDAGRRAALSRLGAIGISAENGGVATESAVLVLAVKPQVMPGVSRQLSAASRPRGQVILSVAAGTGLGALQGWFGAGTPVVRVMPNQPALAGAGVSVLVAGPEVDKTQRDIAERVMGAVGTVNWIDDEALMDAVTAVSGSGPAYFYLLAELVEQTAVALGLPAPLARQLTRETAAGAARVMLADDRPLAELRAAVTSPGGTTAAALRVFADAGLADTVRHALTAARDRSLELGRTAPPD